VFGFRVYIILFGVLDRRKYYNNVASNDYNQRKKIGSVTYLDNEGTKRDCGWRKDYSQTFFRPPSPFQNPTSPMYPQFCN